MKVLKLTLVTLLILAVLAVVVGLFLPSKVHIERSTVIDAPPATVFALVNGFALFNRWSPWFEMDPEARYNYEGPAFGPGAKMSWVSNELGTGSQEITTSTPFERVEVHGDFGEDGSAETYFDITKTDSGSQITWGSNTDFGWDLLGRYQGLMFDTLMGNAYSSGLNKLKEVAETFPNADWSAMDITVDDREAVAILFVHGQADANPASIGQALGKAYGTIAGMMQKRDLEQAGAPMAFARSWGEEGFVFDAGIPYTGDITEAQLEKSPVQRGATPPGRVIQGVHVGPYAGISESYRKVMAFMGAHGFSPAGDPWESYVSDPTVTSQEELITIISYPVHDPVFE
ncbi:MAG: hypothetical protein DRJ65_14885 [Acidobacteria bacterium]|nr:MAG: hypothetical protein DRJ65_14885 [Acidobacteriota bacterium]